MAVVERQLERNRIVVAMDRPAEVVEERVDVRARGEAAAVLVEPAHLLPRPLPMLVEAAGVDPVDGDVRAGRDVGTRELARVVGAFSTRCDHRAAKSQGPTRHPA
jgi:hypothetical protein